MITEEHKTMDFDCALDELRNINQECGTCPKENWCLSCRLFVRSQILEDHFSLKRRKRNDYV